MSALSFGLGCRDESRESIEFTIHGQTYSLKNSRIILPVKTMHGQPIEKGSKCPHCKKPLGMMTIPNEKAKAFEQAFEGQLPAEAKQRLLMPVRADIEIYYPTNLQDVDEALTLDCMQRYGVIGNDRQIVAKYVVKRIDKANPRVNVKVSPVKWDRSGRQPSMFDDESAAPELREVI